ncbi:hypothetical protein Tco_0535362 [Tanacetum coccineum]
MSSITAQQTKLDLELVPKENKIDIDEEPVRRKRVKRSCQEKKSSNYSIAGIVFKETPVKTKSTGKEKVDVSRGKVAEKPQSVEKITPTITSEGTGDKLGVPGVTEDDSTKSKSESWGNDEDDRNNEQEASDEGSGHENESEEQESDSEQDEEYDDDNQEEEEVDQENESEDDEIESDEDKGMDDTTDQFDDDVDTRLKEPTQTDKEVVQGEGADAEMIDTQQGNENLETTQEQTKAAKYDLPGIEDMVPNIWSPFKVAYDRYALWVTHVKIKSKHGYGYLEEIVVRRTDNVLYRFKEGDLLRLRLNDIKDMLLLVVQNRLTNLSGDDVVNFDKFHKDVTKSLDQISEKGTRTLHTKTLKDSFMSMTTREQVLASKGTVQCSGKFGKEKSHYNDQGHQQAAKGKEDDEEFGEIRWW